MICKQHEARFCTGKNQKFLPLLLFLSPSFFPIVLEVVSMCLSVRGVKIYYDFLPPT